MRKSKLIKHSIILFPLTIVFTLVMTFSAKNNFTADYDNQIGVMDAETNDKGDVQAFVEEELVKPFMELRLAQFGSEVPECFDHKFYFNYSYEEEKDLPFYKNQMVGARVVERDCDREHHLYTLKVFYDKKEILVQTSAFDEWVDAKTFINNYRNSLK